MTRFARAKGSKASNERVPEEATPWNELKRKVAPVHDAEDIPESTQEPTNWKQVIKNEKKIEQNLNSVWCEFEEERPSKDSSSKIIPKRKRKFNRDGSSYWANDNEAGKSDSKSGKKRKLSEADSSEVTGESNDLKENSGEMTESMKRRLRRKKREEAEANGELPKETPEPHATGEKLTATQKRRLKRQKKALKESNAEISGKTQLNGESSSLNENLESESKKRRMRKKKKLLNMKAEANEETKVSQEAEKSTVIDKNKDNEKVSSSKKRKKKKLSNMKTEATKASQETEKSTVIEENKDNVKESSSKKRRMRKMKKELSNSSSQVINVVVENGEATVDNKENKKTNKKRKLDSENPPQNGELEKTEDNLNNLSNGVLEDIQENEDTDNKPHLKGSKHWSATGKEFKKSRFESEPYKRRKLDYGDQTMDINGETVVVTRLDGFYIKKEDAVRIKQLEKELFKKAVSREEIRAVVKKERRNAEKSLARMKKKVCFHCRRGGHTLSSCPKLSEGGAQTTGSGICYKCGSTEHSHLECRVSTGYKFATCFICKEEGHIARECPDNPRGLYPQGGACKICGDVTHLRKDCPEAPTKETVTLGVIQDNIEALPETEESPAVKAPPLKAKNKIVKFN